MLLTNVAIEELQKALFVVVLPHVVAGLIGTKNLSYVGGDMFESIPPVDAILLKWILHDWSDEECVKILKNCKEVIPSKAKGGKVIIIDMIVDNNKKEVDEIIKSQLFFDLLMMVVVGGIERDEREWMKLFKDAGFTHYKTIHKLGARSLIEVYPS
ncbi:O-methyltransferase family protein [Abeliophyllum distichum]|uniref:O-methyltransferase family protein n=1 Tax=Abeliophyllum distichum TaxID=126358 RepID=A0ABD1PRL3_9LAMI